MKVENVEGLKNLSGMRKRFLAKSLKGIFYISGLSHAIKYTGNAWGAGKGQKGFLSKRY